jgi:hypothetical protein
VTVNWWLTRMATWARGAHKLPSALRVVRDTSAWWCAGVERLASTETVAS